MNLHVLQFSECGCHSALIDNALLFVFCMFSGWMPAQPPADDGGWIVVVLVWLDIGNKHAASSKHDTQ